MRDEYGLDALYYPFFEGSGANTFDDLILRSGGQDTRTKMKDYYISKSAIEEGNQDGMRGQSVAVYLNGEYWGLYNIRERLNADYLSYHYNFDKDNINIIAATGVAIHGNNEDWLQLKEFCLSNDFTIQENYEKLINWIDVENFTDYIIFQTFFSNTDSGNIKFWRDGSQTMKWRVLFYDVDVSLRENSDQIDMIQRMFGQSAGYIGFSPHIHTALIQNPQYQEYFLQRYAYYLSEVFTDEYLENGIDNIADTMKNEMVYHTQRWNGYGTYDQWLESVENFKRDALSRGIIVAGHLQNFLNVDDEKMKELIPWY
jgi:spore coat protein CotH